MPQQLLSFYISFHFLFLGFLKRGDVLLNVEGTELTGMSPTEAEGAILEAMGRLSVSTIALVAVGESEWCILYLKIRTGKIPIGHCFCYPSIVSRRTKLDLNRFLITLL